MEFFLVVIFILCGIGVPIFFTIKNSKPKNVFIRIIEELKKQPREVWFHFFTNKGLEKWIEEDFKIDDIQNLEILEYAYKDYIWKYKVKFMILNKERSYFFELVKNPNIHAKSRWVINNIYEDIN
jgi:hypothetical protein